MNRATHEKDKNPLGLDAIKVPSAPSPEPDDKTQGEQRHLEEARAVARLKPTERHVYSNEVMRRYLERENANIKGVRDDLQSQLDDMRPRYAALRQAQKTAGVVTVLATTAVVIGNGALAYIGTLDKGPTRDVATGCAVTLIGAGSMFLVIMIFCGWSKRD